MCDIVSENFPETLFFNVHPDNAGSVTTEEPNWIIPSLLYPAMLLGRDIHIEADVSPYLLDNARNDLMHLTRNYHPCAHAIAIDAGASSTPPEVSASRDIVTGFSSGVDSFATLLKYLSPEVSPTNRLTAVAIYQVGALAGAKDLSIIEKARSRIEPIAAELGLRIYSLSSNMEELYTEVLRRKLLGVSRFAKSVSFRNAAAAMVFQKSVSLYLASGNVSYRHATYGPSMTSSSLDAVLQPLFSTEIQRFQCGVAGLGRREKLEYIAGHPTVQKHLDVCVIPVPKRYGSNRFRNCGACEKCISTLVTLEALGHLDKFGESFDLKAYAADRHKIYRQYRRIVVRSNAPNRREDYGLNRAAGIDLPPLLTPALLYLEGLPRRAARRAARILRPAGG